MSLLTGDHPKPSPPSLLMSLYPQPLPHTPSTRNCLPSGRFHAMVLMLPKHSSHSTLGDTMPCGTYYSRYATITQPTLTITDSECLEIKEYIRLYPPPRLCLNPPVCSAPPKALECTPARTHLYTFSLAGSRDSGTDLINHSGALVNITHSLNKIRKRI